MHARERDYGEPFEASINGKLYKAWHSLTPGEVDTVLFPGSNGQEKMTRFRDTSGIQNETLRKNLEVFLENLLRTEVDAYNEKANFLEYIKEISNAN